MVDGTTAEARFQRLLHVLPAASRKEGAALPDLAAALGTSEKRILDDIEQVTARAYYHSGGWPDDVQIMIEPEKMLREYIGKMMTKVPFCHRGLISIIQDVMLFGKQLMD